MRQHRHHHTDRDGPSWKACWIFGPVQLERTAVAAGRTHGFIYAAGAFSTVDVAGARDTQLTRIKNGGPVTGFCTDALNEQHGLTGQ